MVASARSPTLRPVPLALVIGDDELAAFDMGTVFVFRLKRTIGGELGPDRVGEDADCD